MNQDNKKLLELLKGWRDYMVNIDNPGAYLVAKGGLADDLFENTEKVLREAGMKVNL